MPGQSEEEKAQNAIDDIFADIKPMTSQAAQPIDIDANKLFDFASADTVQAPVQ